MDLSFSPADEEFRAEVRRFFQSEYPKDLLQKAAGGLALTKDDYQRSERALAARGWLCVNWPREHGGSGWSVSQRHVFDEELERAGAISPVPMGVIYVGPVICAFGQEDQRARWLPGIRQATTFWAQGYSEPNAGSDLASLRMSATRDGDDYVVNGTKIWTSLAQHADWIFLLARTSWEDRKQKGISFLCAQMNSPGVGVHPIVTIDGRHTLNRVTFDGVRIPACNRIGSEGEGWRYANYLLGNERTSYAHVAAKRMKMAAINTFAEQDEYLRKDTGFKRRLAELNVRLDTLDLSVLRVLATVADGDSPGNEASILKVLATELAQDISELAVIAHGTCAVSRFCDESPVPQGAKTTMEYLGSRAQSIYGGSNEVQKNIIARRVLGL